MRAGPAVFLAASPVATKMPAPMMPPIPMAVRDTGPRTRLRCSPVASVWARASGFLRSSPLMGAPPGRLFEARLGRLAQGLEGGVLLSLPPLLGRFPAGLALLHLKLRGSRSGRL